MSQDGFSYLIQEINILLPNNFNFSIYFGL